MDCCSTHVVFVIIVKHYYRTYGTMAYSSDNSDIEEIEIPIIVLPYQFEPLALAMSQCQCESNALSSTFLSRLNR